MLQQNKNWYALYVSSRQEKKVQEGLINKGIEAYTPVIKTMKQWSDRKKMVELPLITGYVFVKHADNEKEKVFTVAGIVNYVRFEGKPAIINEKEIQVLKDIIAFGYETSVINFSNFTTGTDVKITQGDFKGLEGTIIKKDRNDFFAVALNSIQQH
ncbi:MAG: UpxY family transcription antiterminator, partial [Bacteroidia bacterium]